MSQLLVNSRVRIKQEVVTHIKRSFPQGKGKINVTLGQEVAPSDILGEGHEISGFRALSLARELGVAPHQAIKFLHCKMGQTVYIGELLASKDELFGIKKKMILSPTDGILDLYDEKMGVLRIRALPKVIKIVSGVYGIVDQILSSSGTVLIRTKASLIYGILGCGQERSGFLKVIDSSDTLVGTRQVLPEYRGDILVGGSQISLEALEQAVNSKVAGIISGGINLSDYKKMVSEEWEPDKKRWGDVGVSLLVTEGFGATPIGPDLFSFLKKHDDKFAILDGNRARLVLPSAESNSMIDIREAKLDKVTLVESTPDVTSEPLEEGMFVRVVAPPFFGKQGTVEAIDKTETILPSGMSTLMVTVLGKGKMRVPYLNLEILKL